jgi:two-component sensor histidine kinase
MNPGRWRRVGDTYAQLGEIPASYSLDGFLYDPKVPAIDQRALKLVIAALAAVVLAALAYILILRAFNSRLEVEVASRTLGLAQLNRELSMEVKEREERERLIAESLAEKEVLLKEVHHRVKNNLQVISSIISMQISEMGDPRIEEVLLSVKNRVFSMALVHERLYGSGNLSRIDMDDYLRALVTEIVVAYARPGLEVDASVDAPDMAFPVERAGPLGLIVGEIVANSMKHAFRERARGRIEVRLRREGGRFELLVSDDGVGFRADSAASGESAQGGGSIGLLLVEALVGQIEGETQRMSAAGGGLAYLITFA